MCGCAPGFGPEHSVDRNMNDSVERAAACVEAAQHLVSILAVGRGRQLQGLIGEVGGEILDVVITQCSSKTLHNGVIASTRFVTAKSVSEIIRVLACQYWVLWGQWFATPGAVTGKAELRLGNPYRLSPRFGLLQHRLPHAGVTQPVS